MSGASNLAILLFSMRSFISGILQVMWSRDPSCKGPIAWRVTAQWKLENGQGCAKNRQREMGLW